MGGGKKTEKGVPQQHIDRELGSPVKKTDPVGGRNSQRLGTPGPGVKSIEERAPGLRQPKPSDVSWGGNLAVLFRDRGGGTRGKVANRGEFQESLPWRGS